MNLNGLSAPIKFIIIFLISFVAVISLNRVSFVKSTHFQAFRVVQQSIFNMMHPTVSIKLEALVNGLAANNGDQYDYSMKIYPKDEWKFSPNKAELTPTFIANQSTRASYFGPTALLLILIIATPVGWKRKLSGFLIGFLLLNLLLAMKFSFVIESNAPILSQSSSSLWMIVSRLFGNAFSSSEFFLLLMIPIWALSCLKSDVYERLIYG